MSTLPKAVAPGSLAHLGINADCYVLSNGVRVLSQRGIVRSLTSGNGVGRESGNLSAYLTRLPNGDALLSAGAIEFVLPDGGTALGREATWFVDLLKAYKAAWRAGLLKSSQVPLAQQADAMLDALAGVGIVSLIDEATGYQSIREGGVLSSLFERLLLSNAAKWARFWDDEVVASLCKTYRIQRRGKEFPAPLLGVTGWIYEIVLGSEVHAEVKRRNPGGASRHMHHQFFADETKGLVKEDQTVIKLLSETSRTKDEFKAKLLSHYRKVPLQTGMWP